MRVALLGVLLAGCFTEFPGGITGDGPTPRQAQDITPPPPRDGAVRDTPPPTRDMLPPPPMPDQGPPPPPRDARPPPPPDAAPPPPPPDMALPPPVGPEVCDDADNDQDGRVDEGKSCAQYVVDHCTLSLGWANSGGGPPEGAERWAACPQTGTFDGPGPHCANTDQSPAWGALAYEGNIMGDELGVQLRCAGARPAVDQWVQSRCEFRLGYAEDIIGGFGWAGLACDGVGSSAEYRCARTGGDGRFHKIPVGIRMPRGSGWVVQWRCSDRAHEQRAQDLTASLEIFLGWAQGFGPDVQFLGDGAPNWDGCPTFSLDDNGDVRCVSTLSLGAGNLTGVFAQHVDREPRRLSLMWRVAR